MLDFSKIKLIIWDLDETLWKGTLTDNEEICLNEVLVDFIHASLDRGIVHAICSKNDYDDTKAFLVSKGLWELFVFPSINWEAKGERVKGIIEAMKLRPVNALFVDDNISNLQEARYCSPELQICAPEELLACVGEIFRISAVDESRPRLQQYRLLEEKVKIQESFGSNEDFLMSCNIRVELHEDCLNHLDRIHDLILRSNQLNYTKFRQSKEDLAECLNKAETQAVYVTVKDNFGDYGIVGFYMMVNGKVQHFLFSCRTLGMLVEQYVYMKLGCPAFEVVGQVVTPLNDRQLPAWINRETWDTASENRKADTGEHTVLFKGPCDISQIFSFIEETSGITAEFTYINHRGISVEGYNHTSQIVTSLKAAPAEKAQLIADAPWLDEKMLTASEWEKQDAVIFSMLTDGNLGIYRHRDTGWPIALCEKYYDLTDPKNWADYIEQKIFTSYIPFTEENLKEFSEKYQAVDNSQGDVTLANMDVIYQALGQQTRLILLLGSERPFEGPTAPSYENRHLFHKILNEKLRKWAEGKTNVHLIEIGQYIKSQSDYNDTINHFQKKVYYYMARDILTIINGDGGTYKTKSKFYLYAVTMRKRLGCLVRKLLKK